MSEYLVGMITGAGIVIATLAVMFYFGFKYVSKVDRKLEQERTARMIKEGSVKVDVFGRPTH